MKNAILLAVAAVAVSSLPLLAQQSTTAVQQNAATAAGAQVTEQAGASAQASPGAAQVSGSSSGSAAAQGQSQAGASANGSAAASGQIRPVNGELVGKLDSKSAKAGDTVVVKTRQTVKTADGIVIPKGSRLLGHVSEVQAHESGNADSKLGIEFDRAELKGGQSIGIHSVIESLAPPASVAASSAIENDDSLSGPMVGGRASGGAMGGARAGGGLLGGTVGGATSATGSMASNLGSTTSGAMGSTGNLAGSATSGVGGGLRGAAGATGALGAHATAVPGVMLSSDAASSVSGTLTATNKNVHLDSGTQMVLGISAAASK